jgi:hypothetical protein
LVRLSRDQSLFFSATHLFAQHTDGRGDVLTSQRVPGQSNNLALVSDACWTDALPYARSRTWCSFPEIFVHRAGGGPDGLIIDEHDNLWIACNQSNEILVLEPKQGKVIARLGDFGGIDKDGAPIGFLWSNSLVFHGDYVLVTNLSLDVGAFTSPSLRTIDGPWAAQAKVHTVSKIKKHIPRVSK